MVFLDNLVNLINEGAGSSADDLSSKIEALLSDSATNSQKRMGSMLAVLELPDEAISELADTMLYLRDFYLNSESDDFDEWDTLAAEHDDKLSQLAERIREEEQQGHTKDLNLDEL